ncbi:glycoside hydrolase family 19 protein [Chryseobacterium daeguense]|uniref:glycoside hydrolase family 19 protein n=1 Tax=Chryseobacterium daeguense TaxID=412438 RepID=UPI0003F833AE|nr:glycoside hydrolase family 19 protein [Chryseobacterium daeguense]
MNRKIFFDEYRKNLDPDKSLSQKEVEAIDLFLNFYERDQAYFTLPQWAYVFATVFHETGSTFLPVREAPRLSEDWRKRNFRYYPYYGRGYVQITWDYNYKAYSKKLGVDLLKIPDLAMKPDYAWFILIDGFKNGVFTGKKISDYINDKKKDYRNARRCINGTDRMDQIAIYAKEFEQILLKSK